MTLEMLKSKGLLSTSFEVVKSLNFKSTALSELEKMPTHRITKKLNVVVDNQEWVAISQDEDEKDLVISCKGEYIFIWDKTLTKLIRQQLINDRLVTQKIQEFGKQKKEDKIMSNELNMDLSAIGDLAEMNAFGGDTTPGGEISGAVHLDQSLHIFSQMWGRYITSIVKDEPTVKIGVMSRDQIGADGKKIIADNADPEKVAKAKEDGRIPSSIAVKEKFLGFKESKPGYAGALIAIPEAITASSVQPIDDAINGTLKFNPEVHSSKVVLLPKEEVFTTINVLFGGKIREDERVNAKPAYLKVRTTESKRVKDGQSITKLNSSLVVDAGERKSLLMDDNFIPLKLYKKASPQNPSAEDAAAMNMNIEAAIKTLEVYSNLVQDSKDDVTWDDKADAKVTSKYFVPGQKGKAIEVRRFFDKEQVLPNVQIPVREKKVSEKNGKFRYSFEVYKVDDKENGTFSKPEYCEMLKKIGMTPDDFIKAASVALRAERKGGAKNEMSLEDYCNIVATKNKGSNVDIKGAVSTDSATINKRIFGLL